MKLTFFILFTTIVATCHAGQIQINLKEVTSKKGKIALVIFKSKTGFPDKTQHASFKGFISVDDFPYTIDLPKGEYAVSLFHDENNNKELDTNFIGIPKEAFGFSNDALGLMGPPSFKKAKFKALEAKNEINIKLKQF